MLRVDRDPRWGLTAESTEQRLPDVKLKRAQVDEVGDVAAASTVLADWDAAVGVPDQDRGLADRVEGGSNDFNRGLQVAGSAAAWEVDGAHLVAALAQVREQLVPRPMSVPGAVDE